MSETEFSTQRLLTQYNLKLFFRKIVTNEKVYGGISKYITLLKVRSLCKSNAAVYLGFDCLCGSVAVIIKITK